MTKTFERFLRSLTDDELTVFARERSKVRPPYWKSMRLALAVEASRRGLVLGEGSLDLGFPTDPETPARTAV
jgi:hypothetical protein